MAQWIQVYDPAGFFPLSLLAAAGPVILLFALIVVFRVRSHVAGPLLLLLTITEALLVWRMPPDKALSSVSLGVILALFPVVYIVVGSLFIYNLVVESGLFAVVRRSLESLTPDRRLQALLVAYCFTAFLDSTTGFLTPVTISTSILAGLGFPALEAASLGLMGSSMPSAFGAMALSIVVLSQVSGLPMDAVGIASGRQMPVASLVLPFVMLAGMTGGLASLRGVWIHAVATGATYAAVLFLFSNYVSCYPASLVSAIAAFVALGLMIRMLPPRAPGGRAPLVAAPVAAPVDSAARRAPAAGSGGTLLVLKAWTPFILLTLVALAWSLPPVQRVLDRATVVVPVSSLHRLVLRVPPATPAAQAMDAAVNFNWLSSSGTAILVAAIISVAVLHTPAGVAMKVFMATLRQVRLPVLTMVTMFGAAYLMNYSGMSTTLALAVSRSGVFFPFLSPILGWLGAIMIGSNTACDAWFGSLQAVTAARVGVPPVLAVAANGTAAVFGKIISPHFLAVAAGVAGIPGEESAVFRRVFGFSLGFASLIGVICMIQAYVFPGMIP
ncbi:MAG: L-lactate permease [Ignavibacteriales bacterium]